MHNLDHSLPFDPQNPTTRALLLQLITGRRPEQIPEDLRERVADRCVETARNYVSEFLRIHYGQDSAAGFENMLVGQMDMVTDQGKLIGEIKEAYKNFIELVRNSDHLK